MKLAIFDLDGTLSPQRPYSTSPFRRIFLPNVANKLSALKKQGVFLALATNQGGANCQHPERLSMGVLQAHFHWLRYTLGLHSIRFAIAPARKKPHPIMLIELMSQFNVTPDETLFVGDAETDCHAAMAASVPFVYADIFFGNWERHNGDRQNSPSVFETYHKCYPAPLAELSRNISNAGTTNDC